MTQSVSPWHPWIQQGQPHVLRAFFQKNQVSEKTLWAMTQTCVAASNKTYKHCEILQFLWNKQAPLVYESLSAVRLMIEQNWVIGLRALQKEGADTLAPIRFSIEETPVVASPTFYAAAQGKTDCIDFLLERCMQSKKSLPSAYLSLSSVGTLLHVAITCKQTDLLIHLLRHEDRDIRKQIHALYTQTHPVTWIDSESHKQVTYQLPPLLWAVEQKNYAATQAFLDLHTRLGLDIHITDDQGQTALHWATRLKDSNLVRMLMRAGLDPTARDKQDNTPYTSKNLQLYCTIKALSKAQKQNREFHRPIRNLVFHGITPNVAHAAAASVLHEHIEEIERVVGVGGGAIMATLLAIGCTPQECEDKLRQFAFFDKSFKDSLDEFSIKQNPTKEPELFIEEFEVWLSKQQRTGVVNAQIEEWIEEGIAAHTRINKCTFQELEELAIADSKYKRLVLMVTQAAQDSQQPLYFGKDKGTKDAIISRMVCAACALPGFLSPLQPSVKKRGKPCSGAEYYGGVDQLAHLAVKAFDDACFYSPPLEKKTPNSNPHTQVFSIRMQPSAQTRNLLVLLQMAYQARTKAFLDNRCVTVTIHSDQSPTQQFYEAKKTIYQHLKENVGIQLRTRLRDRSIEYVSLRFEKALRIRAMKKFNACIQELKKGALIHFLMQQCTQAILSYSCDIQEEEESEGTKKLDPAIPLRSALQLVNVSDSKEQKSALVALGVLGIILLPERGKNIVNEMMQPHLLDEVQREIDLLEETVRDHLQKKKLAKAKKAKAIANKALLRVQDVQNYIRAISQITTKYGELEAFDESFTALKWAEFLFSNLYRNNRIILIICGGLAVGIIGFKLLAASLIAYKLGFISITTLTTLGSASKSYKGIATYSNWKEAKKNPIMRTIKNKQGEVRNIFIAVLKDKVLQSYMRKNEEGQLEVFCDPVDYLGDGKVYERRELKVKGIPPEHFYRNYRIGALIARRLQYLFALSAEQTSDIEQKKILFKKAAEQEEDVKDLCKKAKELFAKIGDIYKISHVKACPFLFQIDSIAASQGKSVQDFRLPFVVLKELQTKIKNLSNINNKQLNYV